MPNRRVFLKSAVAVALVAGIDPDGILAAEDSGASVTVLPESVPFDFNEQAFRVRFLNGSRLLGPGVVIYLRANFWLIDQTTIIDGQYEPLVAGLGLQSAVPTDENYVTLLPVDNHTSAQLQAEAPGFVNQQRRIVPVRILSGTIRPGEEFTLTFGRVHSLNIRAPGVTTNANEPGFLCVIGYPNGDNPEPDSGTTYEFVPVSGGTLAPGAVDHPFAILPSQVPAGAPATLRVVALDSEDNVVGSFSGVATVTCSDPAAEFPANIAFAAADSGRREVEVTFHTVGVQWLEITLGNRTLRTNPVDVTNATPTRRILWGDYHNHSVRCDGTGEPSRLAAYARDAAHLDWYVLSSHDAPSWFLAGAMRWDDIRTIVDNAQVTGKFVTLPAFEWTASFDDDGNSGSGHRIVIARHWEDLLPVPRVSDPNTDKSSELFREMIRRTAGRPTQDFLVVPHHADTYKWWYLPADGTAAAISDAERDRYMPLVEIYSQLHGNTESPEESTWRSPKDWGTSPDEICYVVGGFAKGAMAGIIAGGDNHAGRPGSYVFGAYTAVLTNDFTRGGILDALLARHCYAASGARVLMEFSCGSAIMGDLVAMPGLQGPEFQYRVACPHDITRLRIVRVVPGAWSNAMVQTPSPGTLTMSGSFRDESFDPAWAFATYFLVVEHLNDRPHSLYQDDHDRGWSSPIFFRQPTGNAWLVR